MGFIKNEYAFINHLWLIELLRLRIDTDTRREPLSSRREKEIF